MIFQPSTPSRFDLQFSVAGVPVRVHPSFWLVTLLLGASGQLLLIPVWIGVVFISILIHEMGHALAFRRYGQRSHIILQMAGGLTVPEPSASDWGGGSYYAPLSPNQQIIISLAGPVAGFMFALLVMAGVILSGGSVLTSRLFGLIPLPLTAVMGFGGDIANVIATLLLWVNIFWGLVNLLPVFPLDGGQVARNILIQFDRMNGLRNSLWLSAIVGGLIAVLGFVFLRSIFMALLFGLLAFQSYQMASNRVIGY